MGQELLTLMRTFVLLIVFAALFPSPVRAGILSFKDSEPGFWDSKALVVVKIISGTFSKTDGKVEVEVLISPNRHGPVVGKLSITWVAGGASALDGVQVKPGDLFMLCLTPQKEGWMVDRHFVDCFPTFRPAEKVSDLKAENLQKALARAEAVRARDEGRKAEQQSDKAIKK